MSRPGGDRLILGLLMLAPLALHGAAITGRWFGELKEADSTRGFPVVVEMRELDRRVSGVVTTNTSRMMAHASSVDSSSVRLAIAVDKETVDFNLAIEGDTLVGFVVAQKDGLPATKLSLRAWRGASPGPFDGAWSCSIAQPKGSPDDVITLRLYSHANGVAGFAAVPGGNEDLFTMGAVQHGTLTFQLKNSGSRFAVSASGDMLRGTVSIPERENSRDANIACAALRASSATSGLEGEWTGSVYPAGQVAAPFSLRISRSDGGYRVEIPRGRIAFTNVHVDGDRITFELRDGDHVDFDLFVKGDELSGTAVATRDGEKHRVAIRAMRRN